MPTQDGVAVFLLVGVPTNSGVVPGSSRLTSLSGIVVDQDGPVQHDAPNDRIEQVVQAVPSLVRARVVGDRITAAPTNVFGVRANCRLGVLPNVRV